jgi:hypothetical protein
MQQNQILMVPHQCSIRCCFDKATESFLKQLSIQIQTNVSQFVAQEYSDVNGLTAHKPFHVTILDVSPMLNVPYVFGTVNEIASRTSQLSGKILPFCQVCENGEVRLKVDCQDIVNLGHELLLSLLGSNNWYSQNNESLFVTLGHFHGPHRVDFENWLNKELSSNDSLFPNFYSEYLSFSDEWLYVAHAQQQNIPLSGAVSGEALSTNAASASTAPLSAVAGLAGLETMTGNRDIEGYVDSLTLSAEEEASANVATKEHDVGNKHKKHARGQKREKQHHQKYEQNKEIEEEEEEEIVPVTVREGPYKATTAPDGGSVWGSMSSSSFNGKVAPPSAILAMRERSNKTSGNNASTASAKKNLSNTKNTPSAKSAAHKPRDGNNSKHPSSGDWTCPKCEVVMYGRRAMCFKCKTDKPTDATPPVSTTNQSIRGATKGESGNTSTTGSSHLYPRKPKDGDVRDGDWTCSSCKGHNFASKIACFTCRTPRPAGYVIDTAPTGDESKVDHKPGDWTCPKCNENVFAKRNRCYKCSTSKPKAVPPVET